MQSRIFVLSLSVLFFTDACGDDGAATEGPDGTGGTTTAMPATTEEQPTTTTTGAASTTDDTAADPSTSSGGGTTTDAATSDADTTGEPATGSGATTDVETTTGEPDPAVLSACEAYCGRWDECGLQPDLAGCIAGCADDLLGSAGACKDASAAALECKTGLDCVGLLDSVEDGGACSAEVAAATEACDGWGCAESFTAEDDSCELSRECGDEPLRQMICDGDSCTCLEGGAMTGQCAAEGACGEVEALGDKAAACCGFV
jgi:hypothetical protein